jgi:hypothetical protein
MASSLAAGSSNEVGVERKADKIQNVMNSYLSSVMFSDIDRQPAFLRSHNEFIFNRRRFEIQSRHQPARVSSCQHITHNDSQRNQQ